MTTTLTVDGMGCEGCEDILEGALADVERVEDATADRTDGTATVEGDADPETLVETAEFAGYEVELAD